MLFPMSDSTDMKSAIIDGVTERLKDPIIGAFAVSFLITNWDLVVVLLNYKGDFHSNIHFIKAALSPIILKSLPYDIKTFFVSHLKGWHLLRLLSPALITYLWLFYWPKWTRAWFTKIHAYKIDREKIVNDLKQESIELREELVSVKEENINLKEKSSELLSKSEQIWHYDLQDLENSNMLGNFVKIADSNSDVQFLDANKSEIMRYRNLGLLTITVNSTTKRVIGLSLTDKGRYFYTKLLKNENFAQKE